jgi:hypothetical protein
MRHLGEISGIARGVARASPKIMAAIRRNDGGMKENNGGDTVPGALQRWQASAINVEAETKAKIRRRNDGENDGGGIAASVRRGLAQKMNSGSYGVAKRQSAVSNQRRGEKKYREMKLRRGSAAYLGGSNEK